MNDAACGKNRDWSWLPVLVGIAVLFLPMGSAHAQTPEKLTLRQAVMLALQNSNDLKLAQAQYNVALAEARVDHANFLPNLYTGAGAAYTHGFPSLPGGQPPSLFLLNYQQTIFDPALKGQQHAAEDRAKNQKIEIERIRDNVTVRTATTYLRLAKVRHSLDLMRSEQASAEKILQIVRERLAANLALPIDVTRSQLTVARTQEQILKLEDQNDTLGAQLRDLTAIPQDRSIEVDTQAPSFGSALPTGETENEMVATAVQTAPSVREAENERAAREHILRGARLSYFPSISLVGQYAVLSKFNNYNDFYKKFERNNLNVGVEITIPIFAAKTSANVALAKSRLTAAEISLGNRRQEVRIDVQEKARAVREANATRKVAQLELQLAQQSLQLVQDKFDQGQATLQQIEQARLDESNKWLAFLDADFARERAQLQLLQVTGQLAKVFR